jgi:hypothetical protein
MDQSKALTLARTQFKAFVALMHPGFIFSDFHIYLINALQQVADGEITRLAVSVPPRHGKSRLISELFPAYMLGRNPSEHIMNISYGASLASRFGKSVRDLMSSQTYGLIFPWAAIAGDGRAPNWDMDKEAMRVDPELNQYYNTFNEWGMPVAHEEFPGSYLSTGYEGGITGKPCTLGLLDDITRSRADADSPTIVKKQHQFFGPDFYTRLEPGAKVVVVNTRWGENDLIGYIEKNFPDEWEFIRLPAIADSEDDLLGRPIGAPLFPKKYPLSELKKIRKVLNASPNGEKDWLCLYQQNPRAATERQLTWDPSYVQGSDQILNNILISWDVASSVSIGADSTAINVLCWDHQQIILLESYEVKIEFPELVRTFKGLTEKFPEGLHLIEDASNGIPLLQWARTNRYTCEKISKQTNKRQLYGLALAAYKEGSVSVANTEPLGSCNKQTYWELEQYASGELTHSDLVIANIQAISWWLTNKDAPQRPTKYTQLATPRGAPLGRTPGRKKLTRLKRMLR